MHSVGSNNKGNVEGMLVKDQLSRRIVAKQSFTNQMNKNTRVLERTNIKLFTKL